MKFSDSPVIRNGSIVSGPTIPESIEVLTTIPMGTSLKVIGRGLKTGSTYDPVLNAAQIAQLLALCSIQLCRDTSIAFHPKSSTAWLAARDGCRTLSNHRKKVHRLCD